jgi:hypothetical protein
MAPLPVLSEGFKVTRWQGEKQTLSLLARQGLSEPLYRSSVKELKGTTVGNKRTEKA